MVTFGTVMFEIVDKNKRLHVLLRLMSGRERQNLKGAIGASLLFWEMSESIRRVVENSTGKNLPEEDELGFGQWFLGARENLYGTDRIFDSTRQERRHFLDQMGLDFGVKARCYVEGATEYGALSSALGDGGHLEFIDLSGQFIEKKGKGLNFLSALKNDKRSNVYSYVLLDNDNTENVRVIKGAAMDEETYVCFFVADPDFEFENFTTGELVRIASDLAKEFGIEAKISTELATCLTATHSAREFFDLLRDHQITEISKGYNWGQAIMKYALNNAKFPVGHAKEGETRPLIKAVEYLARSRSVPYLTQLRQMRINPTTGDFEER